MIRADRESARPPRLDMYHYSNEGICSWYDFAREIVEKSSASCSVVPITSKEYITRAERPRYSVMNKQKILADYGVEVPHWKNSLQTCMEELSKT